MRRTQTYKVTDEGRDKGKLFLITELPSSRGEDWAMRVLLALMNASVDVPDNVFELGMAGLAEVGLKKLSALPFDIAKPLLEELMSCVQIIPDPSKTHVVRDLIESDIEEIKTRLKLKWEVLNLHVDFSQAAELFKSVSKAPAARNVSKPTITRTSRK